MSISFKCEVHSVFSVCRHAAAWKLIPKHRLSKQTPSALVWVRGVMRGSCVGTVRGKVFFIIVNFFFFFFSVDNDKQLAHKRYDIISRWMLFPAALVRVRKTHRTNSGVRELLFLMSPVRARRWYRFGD